MKCVALVWILLGLSAPPCLGAEDDPEELFHAAQRSEAAGDSLNAYLLYAHASALAPNNAEYLAQKMAMQARVMGSAISTVTEPTEEGERMAYRIETEELSPSDAIEGRRGVEPPRLRESAERFSFDLRGTARPLWEAVGEAFGITILFGPDYQSAAAMPFRVREVSMEEAIRILETITNSFIVPLNETQALVFNDTMDNRNNSVPEVSVAIPIPERISVQDAQELASGIQQTMELRRIAVDAGRRVIFIRDQEAKVMGARKIISDLSRNRAQVEIEIEFISAFRNSALTYGMSLPSSAPIVNFGDFFNRTGAPVGGSGNYATFGGGATLLGVGIADAQAFAMLSRASTDSLLRSQMIALDGQQVTLHIGDRYPIVTGRYGSPNGGTTGSTPQVQYTDLGLILQVTPVVQADGEMSLTVSAEYNVLGATQANGIPIISNRKFDGLVRLKQGEWGIVAGIATASASDTVSGIPLLADIPWVGQFFRKNVQVRDSGQILIVLKPHLVNLPPWETPTKPLYIGTETKLISVF